MHPLADVTQNQILMKNARVDGFHSQLALLERRNCLSVDFTDQKTSVKLDRTYFRSLPIGRALPWHTSHQPTSKKSAKEEGSRKDF
jgi:hypothetical protein